MRQRLRNKHPNSPALLRFESLETRRLLDGAITGEVWNDWNRDGQQQSSRSEYRVMNVEVSLLTPLGDLVDTTRTDRDGVYDFSGVESGTYLLEFVAPEQTEFTEPNQTPVYYEDSDADTATGRSKTFRVLDGETVNHIDAGIFSRNGTQSVRGTVWNDTTVDGLRDELEPRLASVEVQLENVDRNKVLETNTDAFGNFEFPGDRLLPGEYFVEFKRPKDGQKWEFTQRFAFDGTQAHFDSDVSSSSGRSGLLQLNDAGNDTERPELVVDAGLFIGAEVRGIVWNDVDRNGQRSNNEVGVSSVEVRLLSSDGGILADTSTDEFGEYRFAVESGSYQLEFSKPAWTAFTVQTSTSDGVTSDVQVSTGRSEAFWVTASGENQLFNAGVYATRAIPDIVGRVWHDYNADGIQDVGEPGLANAEVELENSRFAELFEVNADRDGFYRIDMTGMIPGSYHVDFNRPDRQRDWQVSPRNVFGPDTNIDSDAHPLNGKSRILTLSPADDELNPPPVEADGGYFILASVSGGVWDDQNGNGLRELNEPRLANMPVSLWSSDDRHVGTLRTDVDGLYEFDDLEPGVYRLEVELGEGVEFTRRITTTLSEQTNAIAPGSKSTDPLVVASSRNLIVWAGVVGNSLSTGIAGKVWSDDNGDGIQAGNEVGIGGVRVQAFSNPGYLFVESATTDSEGRYAFPSLSPNTYTLEFLAPDGTTFSPLGRDENPAHDSDVNRSTSRTRKLPLALNQYQTSIDAGIYRGSFSQNTLASLRLTEIAFIGHGATEFVEVKNIGTEPLDLRGVKFTDGFEFEFSGGQLTSLFPGEMAVVVGPGAEFAAHVDVEAINIAGTYDGDLDREERIEMVDAENRSINVVDYGHYWHVIMEDEFQPWTLNILDELAPPKAWNLREQWRPSSQQGGTPGRDDPRDTPDPGSIVINEVLSKSSDGFNDLVELHNTTDRPIDVSFWYLGDLTPGQDPNIYLTRYRISPGTVIPPKGYLVFSREDQFSNRNDPGSNSQFGLSSYGESVHLVAADRYGQWLGYSDSATFLGTDINKSYGRVTMSNGGATFLPLQEPTFGRPNSPPVQPDVIIDQVMFNADPGREYLRLHNTGNEALVMMSPWQVSGGVRFTFPRNTIIPAGAFAFVVPMRPSDFRELHQLPEDVKVFGPFSGRLNNAGEAIELVRPGHLGRPVLVDRVTYRSVDPWPARAENVALLRSALDGIGDDPISWVTTTERTDQFVSRGILVVQAFETRRPPIYRIDVLGQIAEALRPGDANGDRRFDSKDLVTIFQHGLYRSDHFADWTQGDWTGDGRFDERDLVRAFSISAYIT